MVSAILLGVIQGLSEFLPISSSGHLVVVPWMLGFSDRGLAFDVALHAGTLVAVLFYFWRDWMNIAGFRDDMAEYRMRGNRMLLLLVAATIPGIIAGILFERQAETVFRHPLLVASMLAIFGAFLFAADRWSRETRSLSDITFRDALLIGMAQALAIVPGVSRSGITITTALARGVDRVSAARFSFLLSTPIILGATVSHAADIRLLFDNPVFVAGVLSSALSGYAAIAVLIRFVSRVRYGVFFWYRLLLAAVIVLLFLRSL